MTTNIAAEEPVNPEIPGNTPPEVRARILEGRPRVPTTDSTLGVPVTVTAHGEPPHRLVVLGDSLSHGFQSGAIYNTDISFPAIIAYELGCLDRFRYPRYLGPGGLPLNIEFLARDLESRYGPTMNLWEEGLALFTIRSFMDRVEDYWERGAGATVPTLSGLMHNLSVYGWDLRDALGKTAKSCREGIGHPKDDLVNQLVQDDSERAALRVYPSDKASEDLTLVDAAASLGRSHGPETDSGIETLVVFLGANNVLPSVTQLRVAWSGSDFQDPTKKGAYTVWQPKHFVAELAALVEAIKQVEARHVIWCTIPHVTIPPVTRGVGGKMKPGSRYFPYYTRPWVRDSDFNAKQDPNITGSEARAVDTAIDMYNDAIQQVVLDARSEGPLLDWLLLDTAGLLDRLASRRYIEDPGARPDWWTPYPLPNALASLRPPPDSRFLTGDGNGGRRTGGLFSLDGVHPTTVAYGVLAQEVIRVMQAAGVEFRFPDGTARSGVIDVDFARLLRRDTLVSAPPQNLNEGLDVLGWADETIDWVRRTLGFHG